MSHLNEQVSSIQSEILSDDHRLAIKAVDRLVQMDKNLAYDYLMSLLETTNPIYRDRAALGLHEIGDNRALEPLFTAIIKPENNNTTGTLVFALTTLDCSTKLKEVFDLLFKGSYEVKMGATTILDKQIFEFTKDDLLSIKSKWEYIQKHPEECPSFDECRGDIEAIVNSYLSYL